MSKKVNYGAWEGQLLMEEDEPIRFYFLHQIGVCTFFAHEKRTMFMQKKGFQVSGI